MPNVFDNILQFFNNSNSPSFTRGNAGIVASQADTRFKPRAGADDYAQPQRSPIKNLMSSFGSRSYSGETSPEVQQQQLAENEQLFQGLGWNTPQMPQVQAATTYGGENSGIDPVAFDYLENTLLPLTRALGIPDAVAASQWALEGGREQKANPFGLMRGGALIPYENINDTVNQGYDLTLRDIASRNAGIGIEDFSYSDFTPEQLVDLLQWTQQDDQGIMNQDDPAYGVPGAARTRYEAHSTKPFEYMQLLQDTPEWRYYR